jgi:hypothetical protein
LSLSSSVHREVFPPNGSLKEFGFSADTVGVTLDSLPDSDTVLAQFNRLIQELLRGSLNRNTFRPWEIRLLLDIEDCEFKDGNKREILRRYQRAVQRHMEKGARLPFKLSEYLESLRSKRTSAEQAATRVMLD